MINQKKTVNSRVLSLLLFLVVSVTTSASCADKTEHNGHKERIYLIASSSQYDEAAIPKIKQAFSNSGYEIDTRYLDQSPTPLGYVNTDQRRAETLINALSDRQVKYLWFVRGGAGAINLYPALYLNRAKIAASTPKILVGFSDVTGIHQFVNHELNWLSVHGVLAIYNREMYNANHNLTLSKNNSINEVFKTLSQGVTYSGIEPMNPQAVTEVRGKLDGGNLTLVQSLFTTPYESDYSDKVVLLEDTEVSAKQLDRLLHQLSYNKKFHPQGVIFGQFFSLNAHDDEKSIYKYVLQQFAQRVNYPVYYYPEFGHGETNQPFMLNHQVNILCHQDYSLCSLSQPPAKVNK